MKNLLFSILSLFILNSFSQTETITNIDIIGGPDFNKLNADNDSVIIKRSAATPFIGLQLYLPINPNNLFKVGAIYSIKGSQTDNRIDYRNSYIGLFFHYHYFISPDFSVSFGPQYSILLSSNKINGDNKTEITGYNDFISGEIGFDYRLQKNVSLGLHYEYPYNTSEHNTWPNLKLKLSIKINKNTFKKSKKTKQQHIANEKINTLKNNALLIRLRSYNKQIILAEKANNIELKNKIISNRDFENKKIINAFNKYFKFCPVYFFYSTNTKKILNNEFDNIFLNPNLQVDTNIHFSSKNYFIGEIGESLAENNGTDFSNYGIHIADEKLNIIPHPFPNFVSGYFTFSKRGYNEMVKILNRKLNNYFFKQKKL